MSALYLAMSRCTTILLIAIPLVFIPLAAANTPSLRWASTGGGWRSQFACVGFANIFSRLGILSQFDAISTTSGASWFSLQLFYSKEFYNRVVVADSSSQLYDFVVEWMGSYNEMLSEAIRASENMTAELQEDICNVTDLGDGKNTEIMSDLCHALVYFKGDWASFVQAMLDAAATTYGDSEFASIIASNENRVDALSNTDLLIQSALAPNFRIRWSDSQNDTVVYLGPNNSTLYTLPISTAYVIDDSGTKYRYALDETWNLATQQAHISPDHSFEKWEDFYLYPAEDGTNVIDDSGHINGFELEKAEVDAAEFAEPFGGSSSVIQLAAISSAAAGTYSPLVPSAFTHVMSESRYELDGNVAQLKLFDKAVAELYDKPLIDGFAVCSQWPNSCGMLDGMFVDGWISDNPALAVNIGQYHISGGDLDMPMKVILTNTNEQWPTDFDYTQLLQYFQSPLNEGVEPGSFNWPTGMEVPYQSPQLFGDVLDEAGLDNLLESIPGSNMTTCMITATTIKNKVYGVNAGQKVQIFLINLNEPITTYIATPDLIQFYTEPLATMTKNIAKNEELARRIQAFVEDNLSQDLSQTSSGQSIFFGWYVQAVACMMIAVELFWE